MINKILHKSKLISLEEESHTYSLLNSDIEFRSVTEFIHEFFHPFEEKKISLSISLDFSFSIFTSFSITQENRSILLKDVPIWPEPAF